MYFADLTPYQYSRSKPLESVVHVGWLDPSQPFETGPSSPEFRSMLRQWLLKARCNQMRGFHVCRFCPAHPFESITQPEILIDGKIEYLGSNEIWVPGAKGQIFSAPSLIVHYVEEHQYLPPSLFIEAVLKPVPPDWKPDEIAKRIEERAD